MSTPVVVLVVFANPAITSLPKWTVVFLVTPRSVTPRSTTVVCPCWTPKSYWVVVPSVVPRSYWVVFVVVVVWYSPYAAPAPSAFVE